MRTITMSATELILEGARLLDTKKRDQGPTASKVAKPETPAFKRAAQGKLVSAPAPATQLATQFELGIRDGFSLGELRLWSAEEMAEWTCSPGGSDRFHVHLLADVGQGISAMMPLSSPPTEREIIVGLSADPKLVGLDFFLRHERLLDVVLLDIRNPSAFQTYLMRKPSLVVVAPPEGDFLSVGASARVQIEALLQSLEPTAVLGVGNASLEANLRELPYARRQGVVMRCLMGVLGEGTTDLRSSLVEGIRLWAPSAPGTGA
jgi:hypothetical protein